MLTVKNVLPSDHEDVVQAKRITYQPHNAGNVDVDHVVWANLENNDTVGFTQGMVYVMNDNGKTVASYDLGGWDKPQVSETSVPHTAVGATGNGYIGK